MTAHQHEVMGWVAGIVSFLAYPPYIVEFIGEPTKKFWATRWMWRWLGLKGDIKPHLASWLIWGALGVLVFASSRAQGASASTWVPFMYMIGSSATAAFVYFYGDRRWEMFDVVCGALAVASLILLVFVKSPFWSLTLAIATDGLAAIPTIIGTTKCPADEPRLGWTIFLVGALVNIGAVGTWNYQEAGYTIYLVIVIGYISFQIWAQPVVRIRNLINHWRVAR